MDKTDSVKRGMVVTYHSDMFGGRLRCLVLDISGKASAVGFVDAAAYIGRTPLGMMEGGYAGLRSDLRVHGEDGECLYEHS